MFILYAVAAGLIVGLASGGRLGGLAEVRVRWAPLILVGFVTQVVLFSDAAAARVGDAGPALYVGSTILVAAAILRNLSIPGVPLVALGAASNLAAIVANGGYMPAASGALAALGKSAPAMYSNSAVVASPALELLTDRFALPRWVPFANVFSVGDVLIALGIVVVIVVAMRRSGRPEASGAARQLPLSS
jgi:hypothetical protein